MEFLVTIGCPGVFDPVIFDNTSSRVEITDLFLCDDSRLVLDPGTDLTVLRTAAIAGIIDGQGGNFTAVGPSVAFTDNRARVYASDGSIIEIGAATYSSTGLWADNPAGRFARFWDLMKATGAGSLLDLSSVTNIDAGFSSTGDDINHQQISALDGGVIDLSGVQTIAGPVSVQNDMRFIASGAGSVLDMSALGTISSAGSGRVLVDITDGGHVQVGGLQACSSVAITLNTATDRFEVNDFLLLGNNITITAAAGGTLRDGGDFLYTHEDTADFSLGLAHVECVGDLQQLEVGGTDGDLEWEFLPDDNFGYEQLIIGQAGHASRVELVDLHDNLAPGVADAFYLFGREDMGGLDGLRILGGSTLVIGDLKVYALLNVNGVMERTRIRDLFPSGRTVIPFDKGFISLEVPPQLGDMNCDGVFNGADIDPFFARLGGSCP